VHQEDAELLAACGSFGDACTFRKGKTVFLVLRGEHFLEGVEESMFRACSFEEIPSRALASTKSELTIISCGTPRSFVRLDPDLVEGPSHPHDRLVPIVPVHDQLPQKESYVDGTTYPGRSPVSTRTPNPRGDAGLDRPGERKEGLRVLRVDANLDRMAAQRTSFCALAQLLAVRDPDLLAHDVDASHHLRHRMLDLDPRVHLEKMELSVGHVQELDGPDAVRTSRRRPRRSPPSTSGSGHGPGGRGGRFLDQLLVAALDGAVAVPEVDHVPVTVPHHLDLDVAALSKYFSM